jgi:phosphate/sulfate permease
MSKLSRAAAAIGGFLIMMGMILLGAVVLTLLNVIDVTAFMNDTYSLMFMLALLTIGILNLLAGVILSRR